MKTILVFAGSVLLAATLAACSPSIHDFGHSITFQNGELVAHASGQPNAYVTADGSLRIGNRDVAVTPRQRELLKDYYGESKILIDAGVAIGKAGAELGVHAIGDTISGMLSGKSKEAQQSIEAQASAIDATAQKLCSNLNQLRGTQQAIAAQLPAFTPYQPIDRQTQCSVTNRRTVTVADGPLGSTKVIETKKQPTEH